MAKAIERIFLPLMRLQLPRCATSPWKALNNIDPQRDIEFAMGPMDSLDHSSRLPNYGSKMGIDATRKWASEGFTRPWPGLIEMTPEVKQRVDELWKRSGL